MSVTGSSKFPTIQLFSMLSVWRWLLFDNLNALVQNWQNALFFLYNWFASNVMIEHISITCGVWLFAWHKLTRVHDYYKTLLMCSWRTLHQPLTTLYGCLLKPIQFSAIEKALAHSDWWEITCSDEKWFKLMYLYDIEKWFECSIHVRLTQIIHLHDCVIVWCWGVTSIHVQCKIIC